MAAVAEEALKYKKPLTVDPNAADHMDKAELYKDQKIAANGYLGLRNTTSKQPAAPAADYTSKADLYKEMKQVAAEQPPKPIETPLASDNTNPAPQLPKETATHDKDGFLKAGALISAHIRRTVPSLLHCNRPLRMARLLPHWEA